MKLGDLVEYNNERWRVTSHQSDWRICELTNWARTKTEVPDDADTPTEEDDPPSVVVVCSPAQDWPFATAKLRSEATGPITQILRAGVQLVPFYDWVPGGLYRPGGPVFFNPSLRLRVGEVLVAVHQNGTRGRIGLSQAFGTIARRKARAEAPHRPQGPRSRFDRMLGADPFGEDD